MHRSAEPPDDRFCDLVMKGGITSGIVYPKAIALLARRYRFKSIGGTSAGAIAAALTAAAEFNRRKTNTRQGFDILSRLPEELGENLSESNKSRLLSLFQAQRGTRRLFFVLVFSLNSKGTFRRIASIAAGLLLAYWPATLASILAAIAIFWSDAGGLAAALLLPIALACTIGIWVYFDVTRRIPENGFGLCTGLTVGTNSAALTPWLHELIQRAAGLKPHDPPLTFGMLWKPHDYFPSSKNSEASTEPRCIELQMFSTNLGHGRPYIFPLPVERKGTSRFRDRDRLFFCPKELKPYLPADVLAWMESKGKDYKIEPGREQFDPPEAEAKASGLLEVPKPEDFPVILATRMSLSFPFLLSAVPLWAINYDAPKGMRHFRRCWFSDGGISSNFPMHLFDGLLPLWPTFGISLEPKIDDRKMVYLPQKYTEGYGERWNYFDDGSSASRFGGFVSAILQTMQNWNDNSLARMPGVRDRIARVRLERGEGGMNLNMDRSTIDKISKRGEDAANRLLERFDSPSPVESPPAGWDDQRFVRLSVLLRMIEDRIPDIARALDPDCPYATAFHALIERSVHDPDSDRTPPPGYETALTPQQAEAIYKALETLTKFATDGKGMKTDFKSIPEPELRVRPPL